MKRICTILTIILTCHLKPITQPPFDNLSPNQLESDPLILTEAQIAQINDTIKNQTTTLHDLNKIKEKTKIEIQNDIETYQLPTLPKYNINELITEKQIDHILENRNLPEMKDQPHPQRGIVTKRSNLRSFPTNIHFQEQIGNHQFDALQETELHVNTPVIILHESKDQKWYFIITPTYTGWTEKQNIALATEQDWRLFITPKVFAIITIPQIKINNTILDMSVKLPYISTHKKHNTLIIPNKGTNNYVVPKIINIPKNQTHIGYLPYNRKNILTQAFLYHGTNYSWGGLDQGVDCSSYISNIYRTFGFHFPRNTSEQKETIGTRIDLTGKTEKQKLDILSQHPLSLIYQPGHVMLYLGKKGQKHYIIHASGTKQKVIITNLTEELSTLAPINQLITIP